ncbi:hypothetical protein EWM64_g2843 [Hericium alpestre]|uniref:Major facilitator superfamily (MFS) profile domain-containing protein n=1 Tax=Hericium alpestre TaxID=135208 RepID=A0A4Z0A299_9AGAM|nr:hypothetical protein EWM64_g2843 [Hericium alpestre]
MPSVPNPAAVAVIDDHATLPSLPGRPLSPTPSTLSTSSIDKKSRADVEVEASKDDLADPDEGSVTRLTDWLLRRVPKSEGDRIATKRSVYDDPNLARHYWPKETYENIHRFDPAARWTVAEEKSLVRKIDWKVMAWAALSFSALNLDRNNLGAANSDNILKDLGMTTDDFNLAGSGSLDTHADVCLDFIPDLILYLSYFYTKNELPFRLSLFWMSSNVCSIVSSFISFGVLHMRGVLGKAGWRWLFLVEGLITLSIGIATFFRMPPSPTQTRTWFRPKGWFTEREETICVSRVLRDDPSKGDMHNREGLTIKRLWQACCDYDLWPLYILGLMFGIPPSPPSTYLTLSLRKLGFGTFETNLLTIPSTVVGILTMFGITWISERVNDRSFVSMAEDIWTLPCLVALYCLPANPNQWIYFTVASILVSYPYTHPIQVGWCSRNSGSVASRTVNASLYNMFVQLSSVIASFIYRSDDAPRYLRGNRVLIAIACVNLLVLYPSTKAYYVWRNRQRDKIWDQMTPEERSNYLETTKDIGNRRLDFRFAH